MYRYFYASSSLRLQYEKGRNLLLTINSSTIVSARGKNSDNIRPRRAIMYVPGHDMKKIEKIRTTNVDCAVLDCEDGVSINMKSQARSIINKIPKSYDFGNSEYAVRINSFDSGFAEEDIEAVLTSERIPDTLMIPKTENCNQVKRIINILKHEKRLTNSNKMINLVLFVESAKSLLDLRKICEIAIELSQQSPVRFAGLVFGSDDFCADIGATRSTNAEELLTARQMIVIIAKAFKVQAIDMVHINYKDLQSLEKVSLEGANMGFTGKQVIHPSQVSVVQKAFSPSPEKIEWARELIKQFNQHQNEGKGAFNFRGTMIDKPLLLQAEYIINVADKLSN